MAEIINLRTARKAKLRGEARAKADANAAKFGQSKAERDGQKTRAEQSARALDGHLLRPSPSDDPEPQA